MCFAEKKNYSAYAQIKWYASDKTRYFSHIIEGFRERGGY